MAKEVIPSKTILKCDRCGNVGEWRHVGHFMDGALIGSYKMVREDKEQYLAGIDSKQLKIIDVEVIKSFDLCEGCGKQFRQWMANL